MLGVLVATLVVVLAYVTTPVADQPEGAHLDCRPYAEPRSVADINAFVTQQRAAPGFAGGDVGASARLADGRRFMVFGDTLRPPGSDAAPMVRNSVLVMGNGCAGVLQPAGGGAAIPSRDDGVWYWPSTVASAPDDEGGSRVVVGLMRMQRTGSGTWDYRVVGSSAARFHVPAGGVPELVAVADVGPDDPDTTSPLWSAAATLTDDGKVYLYGTATPGTAYVFGYSLHVARTTVDDLVHVERWEYWDGSTWTSDADAVATLIPADSGVSRALSVFERDGTWYAVSKRHDFLGQELVIWKAPSPTGPFDDGHSVAELPTDDEWMTYLALAHPELLPEEDTVVVSWSVNSLDPSVVANDPSSYRPRFLRVTLP